jgi:hypothetical protein
MTGFAANPGTEVDPTCFSRSTWSPSAERIRAASRILCALRFLLSVTGR